MHIVNLDVTYCIGQARCEKEILRAAKKMLISIRIRRSQFKEAHFQKDVEACGMELLAAHIVMAANPACSNKKNCHLKESNAYCMYHT